MSEIHTVKVMDVVVAGIVGVDVDAQKVCDPECSNGGECYYDAGLKINKCLCPSGYRGDGCQEEINECIENPNICQSPAVCHNTNGSYRCDCPKGYTLAYDGRSCIDRDECADGSHKCVLAGNCENIKGSYICHCGRGYRIPEWDPKRCVDIDECEERLHGCQQNCTNKIGYYRCSCYEGYTKNIINLRKCDDINECERGTDNCAQRCENTLDVNECLTNNGGCEQACHNTIGRHYCSCDREAGYGLSSNGFNCE
uniref:EGF-like domain-containing protein n=1 Tax=Amphimedon queenslandica TaxID=400682 RepID=A0A1X7TTF3_AMPQE